jgi:hypothetical protein
MEDFTANFTDEQMNSMDPAVIEQEANKIEGEIQQQQFQDQQGYEQQQQQPQEGEQGQQQYVDPQVYKDTYDQIFAPFKAAGREFQVRDVNEAVSLMQKGVDYTRKQQALKPRLMEMRALEEQGMLGSNLNYAIDLFKGNPQAIAKLIKEKNIDINQIVPQQTTNEFGETVTQPEKPYVPNNYSVSPAQFELQETFDSLKANGTYDSTMDAVANMDSASKDVFAKNPKYLTALSNLIQSGLYEEIKQEVEHAKIVDDPRIRGKNDFEAYDVLGAYVLAKYQKQAPAAQTQQYPQAQQQPAYAPPPQQQQYQQQRYIVEQRKQGVAPVRQGIAPQKPMYDPLACSDEEFNKINLNDILRM